jgi:hypothetical protein
MSQNEQNVPNFTVEQLVIIGDAIHNSKTAIIIADNETPEGHNVTVCVRGTREKLVSMMYHVFKSNPEFEEVCSNALVSFKMEKIQDGIDGLMGKNPEY